METGWQEVMAGRLLADSEWIKMVLPDGYYYFTSLKGVTK